VGNSPAVQATATSATKRTFFIFYVQTGKETVVITEGLKKKSPLEKQKLD
jgi:hypothetical protein